MWLSPLIVGTPNSTRHQPINPQHVIGARGDGLVREYVP